MKLIGNRRKKIIFYKKLFNCQVGQNGLASEFKKREGDLKTPKGKFNLGPIYIRKDKIPYLKFHKSIRKKVFIISKKCSWCDDILSSNYNKFQRIDNKKLTNSVNDEIFWREDQVYDIIIVINYNVKPTINGKGSAIFIHCSFEDLRSTKGCVALDKKDLIFFCKKISSKTLLQIS